MKDKMKLLTYEPGLKRIFVAKLVVVKNFSTLVSTSSIHRINN